MYLVVAVSWPGGRTTYCRTENAGMTRKLARFLLCSARCLLGREKQLERCVALSITAVYAFSSGLLTGRGRQTACLLEMLGKPTRMGTAAPIRDSVPADRPFGLPALLAARPKYEACRGFRIFCAVPVTNTTAVVLALNASSAPTCAVDTHRDTIICLRQASEFGTRSSPRDVTGDVSRRPAVPSLPLAQ